MTSSSISELNFPVEPELFIDRFDGAEGLTFNGQGQLFIGADQAVWLIEPDGTANKLTDVHTHLGQAGIGERDILAADFGPTNVFRHGPNDDGIVWRITPEGEKKVVATGIADPNFIVVHEDGSYLVSDDGTDKIYLVSTDGTVTVWSDAIDYPNGMVPSLDGSVLYVAQIFGSRDPFTTEDNLWAIPMEEGLPAGQPELVVETGGSMLDGLAMDEVGRVYIADNGSGSIRRFDPRTGELILIAEGMDHVASLVFGEGDFNNYSIYATCTARGGGRIWTIPVGVRGAPVTR
ncbi:MAG: SMP-30/gluconolactonase/LRE family protein [bacterium]|nr:SMP-30/gluconolactonase/LRE family protein [bacterium]